MLSQVACAFWNGVAMPKDKMTSILFDHARLARINLPEAVFCQGKPRETLLKLLETFASGESPVLFTRLDEQVFSAVPGRISCRYDYDPISATAFSATFPMRQGRGAAIVSAGAADMPVSHEAARTLEYLGIPFDLYEDCGVAGLWRLTERLPEINEHQAVIVVAGMEGALASVMGGLTGKPIFAVPTSVGYGISADGRTALNGMLASCAPGVAVVNIDNGYGAACAAARVINLS